MSKILWILNKYIGKEKSDEFFPYFLSFTQRELKQYGNELYFVLFSENLTNCQKLENKYIFSPNQYNLSEAEIELEANRIEKEYNFTFKQAYFADIIQTFKGQNHRKITVPEKYFSDLGFLVSRFLYLEKIIKEENFDVIFSDVSPETEMEFGRVIGYKLNKIVLKTYEGSALGRTTFLQLFQFGKDRLVKADFNDFSKDEAEKFCKNFIKYNKLPYTIPQRHKRETSITKRISNRIRNKDWQYIFIWTFLIIKKLLNFLYYRFERKVLKPSLYDTYNSKAKYIFIGFHLNQESTMVLRSQPYTNQIALVEMISRVLPYDHYLYVRAHPHWPDRYTYKYLSQLKKYPNVRLISETISIHEIVKNSKGILTYNATTGIEALIYNKPVLSFASNLYYKNHPGVDYCTDLYTLGEKLSTLVNRKVNETDTYNFITRIQKSSFNFLLGSSFFLSENDSKQKADVFSKHLCVAISWCENN